MRSRIAKSTYENFDTEEAPYGDSGTPGLSRGMTRRRFSGELEGLSAAHILIARGATDRLGYVATDFFIGTVSGRRGSFVFQHGGTIDRGALTPFGYVVPGTGTGELTGLSGNVRIAFIPPSTHALTLEYEIE